MNDDRQDRIRRRAYEIWERDGRSGDPEDHWREAEQELVTRADQGERSDPAGTGLAAPDAGAASSMDGLGAMTAAGDYSGWTARKDS